MSNKVIDKVKELLKEEDLKELETLIESLVDEKVALKEEELKKNYEKINEEYVAKVLAEETEKIKVQLTEEKNKEVEILENTIIEKLDAFLDNEITQNINEETITEAARNEINDPIVEGIKKLFAENFVELDSEGSSLLKQAKLELESLQTENSKLIEEKTELSVTAEKAATTLLLKDKTTGLTDEQTIRVKTLFEGKSFDEVHEKIDTFIDSLIVEEAKVANEVGKDEKKESTGVITEGKDPTADKMPKTNKAYDIANDILS
jgi:hypothetical protein